MDRLFICVGVLLVVGLVAGGTAACDRDHAAQDPQVRSPGETVWVLMPSALLSTDNGGTTWRSSGLDEWQFSKAIDFPSVVDGWLVGIGSIARTTDGGVSWSTKFPSNAKAGLSSTWGLLDVAAVDGEHAWAVGSRGARGALVLATKDGGATWTTQMGDVPVPLLRVDFVDMRNGWATGVSEDTHKGYVFVTRDGGRRWATCLESPFYLGAVAFADRRHGWVVAHGRYSEGFEAVGTILATDDGGRTWRVQRRAPAPPLADVACCDSSHAWAVGTEGTVLATIDGGRTWAPQNAGTQEDLVAIAFSDQDRGWAIAKGGQLRATVDGGLVWRSVEVAAQGYSRHYLDVASPPSGRMPD